MSIATMILGESGTGKSTSMRNLDAGETLLIQSIPKVLPFPRAREWKLWDKEKKEGNVFVTDQADTILQLIKQTKRKIIVIDDFQYVMANEFMRRSGERGFDKFTEIGRNAWNILMQMSALKPDKRIYVMWHPDVDQMGRVKTKTIGKMLEDKITPEGMFTIVLRTYVEDAASGKYYFHTQSNGSDPAKSPMGMFEFQVDNDLKMVDDKIVEYFGL